MNTLHERLKKHRQDLQWSQEKMAEIGGVKRRAQINYESGERCPDGNYFSLIAAAGADIQWILTGVPSANMKEIVDRQTAFKESVESVVKLQLPKTNEEQADIAGVLYEDKIKIMKDAEENSAKPYATNHQAQNQKMAAEQNPGYSGLCQEQKQLLANLAHCAPEDQEAIQRLAQLAAMANDK